jgi:hypothetical protein
VVIEDLGGSYLGLTSTLDNTIWIDNDAAGAGWSILGGGMDLLTVVAHEMGHLLGLRDLYDDDHADDLMAGTLQIGVSRLQLQASNHDEPLGHQTFALLESPGTSLSAKQDADSAAPQSELLPTLDALALHAAAQRSAVELDSLLDGEDEDESSFDEYVECVDELFAALGGEG